MAEKWEGHTVTPSEAGVFLVRSGSSGKTYVVAPLGGDRAECGCTWGLTGRKKPCSHIESVRRFAEKALEEK